MTRMIQFILFQQDLKDKMDEKIVDLLLAAQRALLGEVVPSLRAVAIDWNNNTILVYFYNDGEISSELWDDYSCIGTEIVASFSNAHVSEKMIELNYPIRLPEHKYWAYRRKEIIP